MHVGMLQFIKNSRARFGEIRAAEKMGIEIIPMGDGRVCNSANIENSIILAVQAWATAQECILSGEYDLLVLDEFTYPLVYDWINVEKVISWLQDNKPPLLHLVITGRNAPKELIDYADLVTEMKLIKHPFIEQNIMAQAGIEY
jgi:cob(I)alamin adenosyltransferase